MNAILTISTLKIKPTVNKLVDAILIKKSHQLLLTFFFIYIIIMCYYYNFVNIYHFKLIYQTVMNLNK